MEINQAEELTTELSTEVEVIVEEQSEEETVSSVEDAEIITVLEKIYDSSRVSNSVVIVQGVFVCFLCGFFLARLVYSKFLRN